MGFSSKLKAHKNLLTLETLRFIAEYMVDQNARLAALRAGIPEAYAGRYGAWLKKHPLVVAAMENELDKADHRKLMKAMADIESQMEVCKDILRLNEREF